MTVPGQRPRVIHDPKHAPTLPGSGPQITQPPGLFPAMTWPMTGRARETGVPFSPAAGHEACGGNAKLRARQ